MKKKTKVLLTITGTVSIVLIVWAIVGGEDNIARKILLFIGAVVFSVVGLTVSVVFSYFYEKGGGVPL